MVLICDDGKCWLISQSSALPFSRFTSQIQLILSYKLLIFKLITIELIKYLCYFLNRKPMEYTTKQAAEKLGISESRVRQMALAGEIEFTKFGNVLVFTEDGIEQAKNRKTQTGPRRRKAA